MSHSPRWLVDGSCCCHVSNLVGLSWGYQVYMPAICVCWNDRQSRKESREACSDFGPIVWHELEMFVPSGTIPLELTPLSGLHSCENDSGCAIRQDTLLRGLHSKFCAKNRLDLKIYEMSQLVLISGNAAHL